MKEYDLITLSNGIRVVHKHVMHTNIAHCGIALDIGTRDELPSQQGIAHFWEHMAFKGTAKRKPSQIINHIESVGGDLNAFTTKEKIFFHASVIDKYYERAFELLQDITFNSVFPEKEIEKEKGVILEEMAMYNDIPEESVQEDFEKFIFRDHSMGYGILGEEKTVKSFKKSDFVKFIKQNIDPSKIVFTSVGNIPFAKVKELSLKYLSGIKIPNNKNSRVKFKKYKAGASFQKKKISQAHCVIGRTTFGIKDEKRIPLYMLMNLLGGPAMNSKLNMLLREKHGYVYSVDGSLNSYSDTGMISIYFGTERKQLDRSTELVMKELRKIADKEFSSTQLQRHKEQLIGQLAMSEENNASFMTMMGKSILDLGYVESFPSIVKKIRETSAGELMELARDQFNESQLSIFKYLPE